MVMLDKSKEMPAVVVPDGNLFCHPSRLANTYEPGVEKIIQNSFIIPRENVRLSIRHGVTLPYAEQIALGWKRRLLTQASLLLGVQSINLHERLAYDTRSIFNGNMAHLVQHHIANLGYLKEQTGYGSTDVTIILDSRPPELAARVFALLGYEVCKTDLPVTANLVEVSSSNFFHLLPWVRHVDVDWLSDDGPKKIFLSRKHTRKLTNESEVEHFLRGHGFQKVYFEDMSIREQWSMMRNANYVVAIHGAALGNLAFQASRTDGRNVNLIELFSSGFVVNPYRKFMAVLGGDWVGCRGRITPQIVEDIDVPGKLKAHAFDDFELSLARPSQHR
jgi:Glycosyltransferase 61